MIVRHIAARFITAVGILVLAAPSPVLAQSAPSRAPGDSLLAACAAAAQRRDGGTALRLAAEAEARLRDAAAAEPRNPLPLMSRARVILQCRLPFGQAAEQGVQFAEAVELLEGAVALDSADWRPHFTLGLSLSRAPKFLGRDAQAVGQLEWVLANVGDRDDLPELAAAYLALGDVHARNSRDQRARTVWSMGHSRFPADSTIVTRLRAAGDSTAIVGRPAAPPIDRDAAVATGSAPALGATAARRAPPSTSLGAVTVTVASPVVREARMGRTVTALDVVTTPGGTADLLQAMQLLPGVSRASESSDLSLRGGDPAEAPVFVDGARLTYASKFESLSGGMFGVLDPSIVRSARLQAGGFSARYGDALSGVLLVETVGHPDGATTRVGVNSTGAGATIMRPLKGGAGVWGTVRASHTGLLLATAGRTDEYATTPYSVDVAAGATRAIGGAEARVVALVEADGAGRIVDAGGWSGPYDSRGQTALLLAGLRGQGGVAQVGPWSITAAVTGRTGQLGFGALDRNRTDGRASLRGEGSWTVGDLVTVNAGTEVARLRESASGRVPTGAHYAPGSPSVELRVPVRESWHTGVWSEALWAPLPALTVIAGVRADRLPGETGWTADPRASLSWTQGVWTSSVSGGIFHQGRWRAREDRPDRDADLGVARRAQHVVAAVEHGGAYTLRAEAYLKRYDAVVDADGAPTADHLLVQGADLLVRPPAAGPLHWWATYSWMRSRSMLAGGAEVPSSLDVTHSLAAVGKLAIGSGWELGSTLRLATGRPFTPVIGGDSTATGIRPVPGALHGERYPTYGRLDARLTHTFPVRDRLLLAYAEGLNLTGRGNVAAYSYDETFRERIAVPYFFSTRTLVLGLEARF